MTMNLSWLDDLSALAASDYFSREWSIDLEIRLYRDRASIGKAAEAFWLATQAQVAAG